MSSRLSKIRSVHNYLCYDPDGLFWLNLYFFTSYCLQMCCSYIKVHNCSCVYSSPQAQLCKPANAAKTAHQATCQFGPRPYFTACRHLAHLPSGLCCWQTACLLQAKQDFSYCDQEDFGLSYNTVSTMMKIPKKFDFKFSYRYKVVKNNARLKVVRLM